MKPIGRKRQGRPKRGGASSEARLRGPWYVLWGARLLVGGSVIAVVLGAILLVNACNARFARVLVPGDVSVWLDPGSYSVFYEYPDSLAWSRTPEVEFLLQSPDGDRIVPLYPPGGEESQTEGTRVSVLLYNTSIDNPGSYELSAWYTGDQTRADIAITIGRGFSDRLVRFVGIIVFLLAGFGVWAGIAILVSRYFHPPAR